MHGQTTLNNPQVHKYLLDFLLVGSTIEITLSAKYLTFSRKYSFYRPLHDALEAAVGGRHITRPPPPPSLLHDVSGFEYKPLTMCILRILHKMEND